MGQLVRDRRHDGGVVRRSAEHAAICRSQVREQFGFDFVFDQARGAAAAHSCGDDAQDRRQKQPRGVSSEQLVEAGTEPHLRRHRPLERGRTSSRDIAGLQKRMVADVVVRGPPSSATASEFFTNRASRLRARFHSSRNTRREPTERQKAFERVLMRGGIGADALFVGRARPQPTASSHWMS